MNLHFIEVTQASHGNWGKFAVGRFTDAEWATRSALPEASHSLVIGGRGWTRKHLFVLDLQTGEGAIFYPGGFAKADLEKHRVWVCPMFEPFLTWLYRQDLTDLDKLPSYVELTDDEAPFAVAGYRRGGGAQ